MVGNLLTPWVSLVLGRFLRGRGSGERVRPVTLTSGVRFPSRPCPLYTKAANGYYSHDRPSTMLTRVKSPPEAPSKGEFLVASNLDTLAVFRYRLTVRSVFPSKSRAPAWCRG